MHTQIADKGTKKNQRVQIYLQVCAIFVFKYHLCL